jgi:hypothetical protein
MCNNDCVIGASADTRANTAIDLRGANCANCNNRSLCADDAAVDDDAALDADPMSTLVTPSAADCCCARSR